MQRFISWQWRLLVGVLGLLPGLEARADPPVESTQGTHVHGTVDRFEHVNLSLKQAHHRGLPFSSLRIEQGKLWGEWQGQILKDELFVGVTFSAVVDNQPVGFAITGARAHTNVYTRDEAATAWEYQVVWRDKNGSGPLCPGNAPALAIPGRWDSGVYYYSDHPKSFFFACLPYPAQTVSGLEGGGVAAKCVDWGYAPWSSRASAADPGSYHASCVAMAMADMCAQGLPNTVEGTPIVIFHDSNVLLRSGTGNNSWNKYIESGPLERTGAGFEAAWTSRRHDDGMGSEGWRTEALCLTKKRWSTLPLNGTCPGVLPDPREDRSVRYCDTTPAEDLLHRGAVLFSYSQYADAGLYRFKHKTTHRFLTTTVSIDEDPDVDYPASYLPTGIPRSEQANYALDESGFTSAFEGTILAPHAPEWFPGMTDAKRLVLLGDGKDNYLTQTADVPVPTDFFTVDSLQGYVYGTAASTPHVSQALRVWKGSQGNDFVTTLGDATPKGYGPVQALGFTAQLQP